MLSMLSSTSGEVAGGLAFLLFYSCLCWLPGLDTTQTQRNLLRTLRLRLQNALGLEGFAKCAPDAIENGASFRYQPAAYLVLIAFQILAYMYDGHFLVAIQTFVAMVPLSYFIMRRSYRSVVNCGRFIFILQTFVFVASFQGKPYSIIPPRLVRGIRTRTFSCLTLTERLDEALLQMLSTCWVAYMQWGWDHDLVLIPVRLFFMCILPVHLLGLRERLASTTVWAGDFLTKNKAEVSAALLPVLGFIIEVPKKQQPAEPLIFVALFGAMAIWLFVRGRDLDSKLMGLTLAEDKRKSQMLAQDKWGNIVSRDESDVMDTRMTTLTSQASCGLNTVSTLAFLHTLKVPLPALVVSAVVSTAVTIRVNEKMQRRPVAFTYHTGMLAVLHHYMHSGGNYEDMRLPFVLVMTSRAALTLVNRESFALAQAEAFFVFGLAMFYFGETMLFRFIVSISIITLSMGLMTTLARERPRAVLKRENDAHAFLAHALKQKFCAVSSALEHCLESVDERAALLRERHREHIESGTSVECNEGQCAMCCNNNNDNSAEACRDDFVSIRKLIAACTRECAKGHEACHAVNVVRNVRRRGFLQSETPSTESSKFLAHSVQLEMLSWISRGVVVPSRISFGPQMNEDLTVSTHWEVLKAFVVLFTSRGATVRVDYVSDDQTVTLRVLSRRQASTDDSANLISVCRVLNASLLDHAFGFAMKGVVTRYDKENGDVFVNACAKDLSVAVLDDSSLIRKSVQKALEMSGICARERTIYRGASSEECLAFPQEVCRVGYDLVIVDENLGDDILGSNLAVEMRRNGFKGCIVLHSALSSEAAQAKTSGVFDGIADKTTSRRDFIKAVSDVFTVYSTRKASLSMRG